MSSYFARPVPILDNAPTTIDCRSVPVDLLLPQANEPLVNLRNYRIKGQNYYGRADGGNPPYMRRLKGAMSELYARTSVAEMLVRADEILSGHDLELFVLDAYRPIECQIGIWDFFWEQTRKANPEITDEEVENLTQNYVSDPRSFNKHDSATWPLHSTGGAVDVTLRERTTGKFLDMGSAFDEMVELSHTDAFERELMANAIAGSDIRLINRRLLYGVMCEVGFTNYAYEYWHFDYGTKMFSVMKSLGQSRTQEKSFYGFITLSSKT